MLSVALTGDPCFFFCLPRLLLRLHRPGTEEALCPLPPLFFVSSFDFLLKTIVSRGVRRIVAFPFIPPLDVTLGRGHFLVSDALTPDTSRQMWSVVSQARLTAPPPAPPPSLPKLNEKRLRLTSWASECVTVPFHLSRPCLPILYTFGSKHCVLVALG